MLYELLCKNTWLDVSIKASLARRRVREPSKGMILLLSEKKIIILGTPEEA